MYKTLVPFLYHVIVTHTALVEWEIAKKLRVSNPFSVGLLSMVAVGVREGIEDPNIEKCTLSIISPETLCLDIKTCSILKVGCSVG